MKKILGMGNALVDIMTVLPNEKTLSEFNLPKGSMQLSDNESVSKLIEYTSKFENKLTSGGSAANTIHGVARLGLPAGFIGKVGNDSHGNFFSEDLVSSKIEPKLSISKTGSGVAVALVSPDSERTFLVSLGAAVELVPEDITDAIFEGYDIFHIEGYLVQNHELIEKAVRVAKQNGLKVSLDLASYNVVEDNLDFLKSIIEKYVDIVFANEEESKAFTGLDPEESLNKIADSCEIAIVKIGKNGSLIKTGDKSFRVGVIEAKSIDTTGAGDMYASGFIYGLTQNYSLDKCGKIGAIISGNVIEVIGAKMSDERWTKIHKLIAEL